MSAGDAGFAFLLIIPVTLIGLGFSFLIFLAGFAKSLKPTSDYRKDIFATIIILALIIATPFMVVMSKERRLTTELQIEAKVQVNSTSLTRKENEIYWNKQSLNIRKIGTYKELSTIHQKHIYDRGWGGSLPDDYCCVESKDGRVGYTLDFGNNKMVFVGNEKFGPYKTITKVQFSPSGKHFAYIADKNLLLDGVIAYKGVYTYYLSFINDNKLLYARDGGAIKLFEYDISTGASSASSLPYPFMQYGAHIAYAVGRSEDSHGSLNNLILDGVSIDRGVYCCNIRFVDKGNKLVYTKYPNNKATTFEYDLSSKEISLSSYSVTPTSNFIYPSKDEPYRVENLAGKLVVNFKGTTSNVYSKIVGDESSISSDKDHITYVGQRDRTFFAVVDNKEGPWFDYVWPPHFSEDEKSITYGTVLGNDIFIVKQNISDFELSLSN